jgi:hypothetical protein
MKLGRSERRRGTPERGSELSAAELALIASCGGRIRKGDWALIESVGLEQAAGLRSAGHFRTRTGRRAEPRSRLWSSLWIVASAVTSVAVWRRKRKPVDRP